VTNFAQLLFVKSTWSGKKNWDFIFPKQEVNFGLLVEPLRAKPVFIGVPTFSNGALGMRGFKICSNAKEQGVRCLDGLWSKITRLHKKGFLVHRNDR